MIASILNNNTTLLIEQINEVQDTLIREDLMKSVIEYHSHLNKSIDSFTPHEKKELETFSLPISFSPPMCFSLPDSFSLPEAFASFT